MSNLFVNTIAPQSGSSVNLSGSMKITGNLEVTGTLHAKTTDFIVSANSTTFGDSASDTVVFNAATASVSNGLNFDANTLVIDSANNRIGIGVAAPTTSLDVNGTITSTSISMTGDLIVGDDLKLQSDSSVLSFGAGDDVSITHTNDVGIHLNAAMRLAFRDQGGEYVHSVSDGNLGVVAATSIDLKSPQIDIGEDDASDVTINLLGSTNDMAIVYDESTKKLAFDTTDLVIDAANGKVGIGTASPTNALTVAADLSSGTNAGIHIAADGDDDAFLDLTEQGGSSLAAFGATDAYGFRIVYDGGAGVEALQFKSGDESTINTRVTIKRGTGNVGINDDTPTHRLDINGTIRATGIATFDANIVVSVDADANDTTADSATGRIAVGAGDDLNLYHNANSYVVNNTGDLIIATEGSNGAGIILDAEDDTVEIKYSGVLGATFDGDGLDLVTGDAYQINGASVLNATTLGSAVVASSLTSVGTLTALQVDNININGATITSDTTATIDATGDIALSADGGNVTMDDGTTTIFDFDVDGTILTIHDDEDTGDKFSITVAQHGATTITTVDDDAAAAHLVITADGTVDIDSAGTMTLDSGANIHLEPAAGSHILLDGTIQVDAGVVTGATSITTKELSVLSGDSGTLSKIVMGLDTSKATIGVAQATDTFFTDTAAGDIVVRADDNNSKVHIGAGTSGIAGMVVTEVSNVGKVGIGVADPDAMLEVFGTTTQLKISNNVDDFATMTVGTHGDLTITTVDDNAAAADLTLTIDGDIIMTPAGGDVKITGTNPKLTIGDADAEDTMLVFDGNAQDFRIGLDDGTDTLEIGHGSAHGTNTAITVDSSGQITKLNVPAAAIAQASDHILFFDGGATGAPKVESVDDFLTAIAGSGVSVSSSQLTVSTASSAADDITAGDAAVTITTTSGNITIDAAADDSDIILKGTDGGADTTFLTIDGSDGGTASFNHDVKLANDGAVLGFGADNEITITHVHNEGLILQAAATNTPILEIKNTHNGGTAGILKFNNTEGGTDGADDDKLGSVEFHGNDDGTPSVQQYAGIVAEIHDATSDEESGKLTFQVASHDGGVESGLVLMGGSVDAEVDVEIGNGTASLTTVMGDLQINGGDINSPSGGGLNVAPSLDDGQSLKLGKNGAVEVVITPHGTAANEIYSVTNTSGNAATAIAMTSTAGGISLTAETNHGVTISTSTPDAAGAGVSSAVGVTTTISKVNGVIETVILVDFSGLTTQSSNLRIIGDGSGTAELTKITHEKNGYIYRAEIGCIETPTGGGSTVCTDIDLVADTTARAGGYDLGGASSDLIVVNAGGSWAIGKWEPSNVAPAGGASLTAGLDDYFLMLASGADTGGASGTYNAGKFVIKLYGASF